MSNLRARDRYKHEALPSEREVPLWKVKREAWAHRERDWFKPIRAAGFEPLVMDDASRHCRVKIQGRGWVDFWPSTGRWMQSPQKARRPRYSGFGLTALLIALHSIRDDPGGR